MNEKYQLISSLVLFNHLSEKKKDANSILDSIIVYTIKDKQLKFFGYLEICEYLKNEFGLRIPQIVVRKRLVNIAKDSPQFLQNKDRKFEALQIGLQDNIDMKSEIDNAIRDEKQLFSKLFSFIEIKTKNKLLEAEKEIIKNNFISHFLGIGKDDKYGIFINAFILENQDDTILKNIVNGIVSYNGLVYQNTFENRKFDRLNVYINMEIIFHYMGYNGDLFKQIVDELFEIIIKINQKKKIIFLCYTSKEKKRIDDFFNAIAKNTNTQKNTASKKIIEKCGKDTIKIQDERLELFKKLECNSILEKDLPNIDFNLDTNKPFNINSNKLLEDNKEIEDISEILEFLNKLSILRANHQCTIETAKYIFLTEEKDYISIANDIKRDSAEQRIPLALNLQYLTSILWYKLGSNFSNEKEMPLLFRADTRAKISLALDMNKHSEFLFDEIERRKEELDETRAKEILYLIRSMPMKPEDIDSDNMEDILELSNSDLNYFIKKQEKDKKEKKDLENENKNLKTENQTLSQELNDVNLEKEKLQQQLNEEKARRKQREKEERDKDTRRQILFCRFKQFGSMILVLAVVSSIYIFLPQKWLDRVKDFAFIFGFGTLGTGGFLIWLYTHFNKKIRNMQEQTEEEK